MCREEIEQLWRESFVRAVVKRQCNIGPVHVNRIEGNLRLSWRHRRDRCGRGITSFDGARGRGTLPESALKKQETDRGEREQLSGEHGWQMRERKLPVYLAEGACNASRQPPFRSFTAGETICNEQGGAGLKNGIFGNYPAPEGTNYTSARAEWRVFAGGTRRSRNTWLLLK
jgi:hypothetical protein